MKQPTDFRARAAAGWDGEPPDWIEALADACQARTQAAVARELKVADTRLSQALGGYYAGDMIKLEAMVRGALMRETVPCPVLGEIGKDRCVEEQSRPWSTASSVRSRLYRACRGGCPHAHKKRGQS